MATTPLDRLKSQLLISGVQQENNALYQVIVQLIDYLRNNINTVDNLLGSPTGIPGAPPVIPPGGLLGVTYLTKNPETGLLPNSKQLIAGSGIQFNDAGNRRIISTALPHSIDGEDGIDGLPGIQGFQGIRGISGKDGIPGIDGFDGIDGIDGIQGLIGPRGITGINGIPGLDGFDGEPGESLIPGPMGPQGPAGVSAGRIYYLDPSAASDIAGYKNALAIPSALPETTIASVLTLTTDTLLASFATLPGAPDITSLPAGTAFRHFHVITGGIAEIARLKVELYRCNSDGSGETLLRTGYSSSFSGATIREIVWNFSDSSGYTFTTSQRIVFKVYGARVSGPANCNLTVYFDGNDNASYIQTTISTGLTGQQGIQGIQGIMGFSGLDGDDGLDSFVPGPRGIQGIPGINGIGIPGLDAEEPELVMMIPGPIGLTGPAGAGSSLDIMASRVQMRF